MVKLRSRTLAAVMAIFLASILMLSVPAYAQGSTSRGELAKKLIDSYDNVKTFLLNVKNRLDEERASKIGEALKEADPIIEEAKNLLSNGDFEGAVEKAKTALSIVKGVLKDLRDVDVIREAGKLRIIILRMNRSTARVEGIIRALSAKGVNTSNMTSQLEEARSLIKEAKDLLRSGDVNGAREKLKESAKVLRSLHREIRDEGRNYLNLTGKKVIRRIRRIKEAAERCVIKLDELHKSLVRQNKTQAAGKVLRLKNEVEKTLISLKRHLESDRNLALKDARKLMGYLMACRRMRVRP